MPFRWTIRILFIDTDASGRIHYTAMLRYFEAAELEFFREIGVLHSHPDVGFPRVHVECDYRAAIRFDDVIVIEVTVGRVGGSSIELKFRAMKGDVEAASGRVVIACMNRSTQNSAPVPEIVRERIAAWLNR